jgi:hypothetical protein
MELLIYIVLSAALVAGIITPLKWAQVEDGKPSIFDFALRAIYLAPSPRTSAPFRAASSSALSSGYQYMSAVIAIDACPSCLLTMSSRTPAASANVA